MKTWLLALLLIFSCSSHKQQKNSTAHSLNEISDYYQQWRKEFNAQTLAQQDYADTYEQYLRTIASTLFDSQNSEYVSIYLNGLKEMNRKLKSAETKLAAKVSKTELTKRMNELSDELNEQRIEELKTQLGEECLEKLLEINEEFGSRYESGGPGYNYPI